MKAINFATQIYEVVLKELKEYSKLSERTISGVVKVASAKYLKKGQLRPFFRNAMNEVLNEKNELLQRLAKYFRLFRRLMKLVYAVPFLSSARFAFAPMDCEKKLSQDFETLDIDVKKPMKSQDYLNADLTALGKKAYKTTSPSETQRALEAAKMHEATDSRFNEIVRVCSAIRAYSEVGVKADEIEMKTLSFQNGWSETMREPL